MKAKVGKVAANRMSEPLTHNSQEEMGCFCLCLMCGDFAKGVKEIKLAVSLPLGDKFTSSHSAE